MANEVLVQTVKNIQKLARSGKIDEGYEGYGELFGNPAFATYLPEDQKHVLKLIIHTKGTPQNPTPQMVEAHRVAIAPLTELVSTSREPTDYEMLGMCHVIIGNEATAAAIFREGHVIAYESNPQSDVSVSLRRRISQL